MVETITKKSNQHEFQGVLPFRNLLGLEDRRGIPARFIWLSGEQEAISDTGFMSWSNVRKGKKRSPEYHLYYSGNSVTELMQPGDVVFLALQKDGDLLAVVVPVDSTIQNQLLWLFGLPDKHLLTLEPGISENQTNEMRAKRLQLVIPRGLHETYRADQQSWLMSFGDFIGLVRERQG